MRNLRPNLSQTNGPLIGLLVCAHFCCAGEDNPRSAAKVGDWAEYLYTYSNPRPLIDQPKGWKEDRRMIQTVVEVAAKSITIEYHLKVKTSYPDENGKEVVTEDPDTPMNIPRPTDIALDLVKEHFAPIDDTDTLKRTGKGSESIEISGKKCEARWISFEIIKDRPRSDESWKIWYDPEGGAFPELKTVCEFIQDRNVETRILVARGNKNDPNPPGHQELIAKIGQFYDKMTDQDFEGRDLFVQAATREVCPDEKDIFAWMDEVTKGTRAEWTRLRGERVAKRELAVTALLTKLTNHPDKVSRLEIALKEASQKPKPDTKAYMEAVEQRIKLAKEKKER